MLIVERSAAETTADYLTRSLRMQRRCSNKATCSNRRNPLITHFLFFSLLIINNYQSIVGKCYYVFFNSAVSFSLRWCYSSYHQFCLHKKGFFKLSYLNNYDDCLYHHRSMYCIVYLIYGITVKISYHDNISNLSLFLSGMCFPVSRINSSSVGMYCKHIHLKFPPLICRI